MRTRRCICASLLVALSGCMHTPEYDREFSKEWADQITHEKEIESRKARIRGEDKALIGKESGKHVGFDTDESGQSKLSVGGKSGLSADLNVEGGKGARVLYKIRW